MIKFLGFMSGIIVAAALVAIFFTIKKKTDGSYSVEEYDERQNYIRGKGYKIAFITTICTVLFTALFTELVGIKYITTGGAECAAVFIGLIVFAVYCIMNDAFYTLKEKSGSYMFLCIIIAVCNGGAFIMRLFSGSYEGVITILDSMNISCCICFICILAALHIKRKAESKKGDGDDE